MATRIKEKYLAEAVPALQQKFGYKNVMEIPKLSRIVINMGLGDCKDNAKAMEMAVNELTIIAGQKPQVTKAKKSIANFKVREGQNVGAKVTLRGARMEEFMDKLVSIALPHPFHCPVALQMLSAGKHVLCEKNMVATVEQAETVFAEARARGRFVMEAMWSCFVPSVQKARQTAVTAAIRLVLCR